MSTPHTRSTSPTRVRILGCSGGIGRHLRTTSMLVDDDILIDAGTGVGDLTIAELKAIDHVFLTHSHLDHIACLPMLVDTVGDMRGVPLTVHATPATLEILRDHVFNWKVWPDFTTIPNRTRPFMHFRAIELGETLVFGGRRITVLPAEHTVPAVGYQLDSGRASLVFTGDTTVNDALWPVVNAIDNLRVLIIETAFPDKEHQLARASKHLCPSMLVGELSKLTQNPEIFITHLKPSQVELTMREIDSAVTRFRPRMLEHNQIIEL